MADDTTHEARANARQNSMNFHYQEYTRIANRIDAMVDGSFTDFKMLGVIGATLGCHPMVESLGNIPTKVHGVAGDVDTNALTHNIILLMGFTAILVFTSILAIRYMTKYNIINRLLGEMKFLEEGIRDNLEMSHRRTFNMAGNWLEKEEMNEGHHHKIVKEFYFLFGAILLLFPVTVFAMEGQELACKWNCLFFIALYLLAYFICICMVMKARIHVYRDLNAPFKNWSRFARIIYKFLLHFGFEKPLQVEILDHKGLIIGAN